MIDIGYQEALIEALHKLDATLKVLHERLGSSADVRSSVEIRTSARGFDVGCKAYSGSPIQPAGDAAIDEYIRVYRELEAKLMGMGIVGKTA